MRIAKQFGMNRKKPEERARLLKALVRQGSTQRALTDDFDGVSNRTVDKLLRDVGDWAIWFLENLPPIDSRLIQVDEMWSFVGAKHKNRLTMKNRRPGVGNVWFYAALCAETKLIIAHHFGDRRVNSATKFFRKLDRQLIRKPNGEFKTRPVIVSDGLDSYVEAGSVVFGEDADRAMMIKKYSSLDPRTGEPTPRSRYVGSERRQLTRTRRIPKRLIHTSYIERVFGTLREQTRRCIRQTLAFSKCRQNHERHIALWIIYYNFCWTPRPQYFADPDTGEIKGLKRVPPAMLVGLSDRPWNSLDLIEQSDAFHAKSPRLQSRTPDTGSPTEIASAECVESPFWVYHSPIHYKASVHRADCSSCRHGGGQIHKPGRVGQWYPCHTEEEAAELARELEPDRHTKCNKCLGSYNVRGRYGRSR